MKQVHDPYSSLRIRDFRLFISARLFLTLGTQMQSVIVGWQIYEHTKDPLALGLIGLSEAIPFIITALFAGHVADILERKKIIISGISLLALGTLCLLYFTLNSSQVLKEFGVFPIYIIIFLTGIARAFIGPALFAFLSQLLPKELYSNAATFNSTIYHLGSILGPAFGGLLYGFIGISLTYSIDIALILISIVLFSCIASRPLLNKLGEKEPLLKSLSAGVKFVFKTPVVLGALSLDLFAVFFGGAVALLPIFANEILKLGPEGLGLLRSAPAFGAVLMALVMIYKPPTMNAGRNLNIAVTGFGLCMILFALSTNIYLSFILLTLSGAFDNVSVVIRSTILQLMTPNDMRGRVSAVNSIFIGSSNEIGEFESGLAAKIFGLIPSVIFGGLMTIIVVITTFRLVPKLKKLNLNDLK